MAGLGLRHRTLDCWWGHSAGLLKRALTLRILDAEIKSNADDLESYEDGKDDVFLHSQVLKPRER